MSKEEILDLLHSLEDYMDDRSDVSGFAQDRPNKEMSLLIEIRSAIECLNGIAEQECIGYDKWKLKNGWKWDYDDKVWKTSRLYHVATNDFTEHTHKSLYQLYLKSKQLSQ